jgi:hypothetical protein
MLGAAKLLARYQLWTYRSIGAETYREKLPVVTSHMPIAF